MQHWQLPFLGLSEIPAELTEFDIRYFLRVSPWNRMPFSRAMAITTALVLPDRSARSKWPGAHWMPLIVWQQDSNGMFKF